MDKNVACEWWPYFQKVALCGAQCSLTHILIKEVSLGAIWRWIQSSRSYAHQYCLCMRCHSQWIPKAKHILHTLDVCLPITTQVFLLGRDFFTSTAAWCDFLLAFFPRVCTNVYFHACWSCRLQQVTEAWEQKQAQAAAHDEHHPVAKAQEEGKVAGCESMQEIAATIAPSCTVNLSNIKAAKWKSCSSLCMMWRCDASVNRFKCKQNRSSQLDGVDLYMGASRCWAPSSHSTKVQRSILGQELCGVSIHVLLVHV